MALTHTQMDRRSLEMHQRIAERLRERPDLIQIPRSNVQRWLANMDDNDPARGSVLEWATILDTLSLDQILELITTDNENAARLRQSAPFAGILTPQEVWRLKQEFSRAPRPA